MNSHTHESYFGPPSEPIDIAQFIKSALDLGSCDVFSFAAEEHEPPEDVVAECSVADIKNSLLEAWNDPRLSSYLLKKHETTVAGIHDSADTSNKRKRKRTFNDPSNEPTEGISFQKKLDSIQLRSWPLTLDSALFIRAPKNSDQNALTDVKRVTSSTSTLSSSTHEALLTVTVYNRLAWGHGHLVRASQHVLLASQTLGDLFHAIPCSSNELLEEIIEDDHLVGYEKKNRTNGGVVVCIDGLAYGDSQCGDDYAEKLIAQVNAICVDKRPSIQKAFTTMHETPFTSLSLRLNEPYWLLHQGNCEHFIVIEEIRLQHPSDTPSGYPLTIQITPPLLDLCRACSKVPAVWSIVGDIRLGESPCVLCDPCWKHMGDPDQDEQVLIVPLPKYEHGWRS